MTDPLAIASLAVVIIAAGLLVFTGRRAAYRLRALPALERLLERMHAGIEQGTRLHVSLGNAGVHQPESAAALAGLAASRRVQELSAGSDLPSLATSGDGTLSLLSKDSIREVEPGQAAPAPGELDRARLTGPTPLSYTAGLLPVLQDEGVTASLLAGSFGPEIALAAQAAEQQNAYLIGGSEALPAQAVFYVSASDALVGEEVFAAPAYLQTGNAYRASLQVQDILRWLLIAGLLTGAVLSAVGLL